MNLCDNFKVHKLILDFFVNNLEVTYQAILNSFELLQLKYIYITLLKTVNRLPKNLRSIHSPFF